MTRHVLPGDPPVEVTLRRSARARRISLRVSGIDGRVTLTLPRGASEREALDFAREKAAWLRRHLDKRVADVAVGIGAELPFRGGLRVVVPGQGRQRLGPVAAGQGAEGGEAGGRIGLGGVA